MKRDPERQARYEANRKARLANDPEYRDRVRARNRERWHIKKQDPVYISKVREQQRANSRRKYNTDPAYKARVLDNHNRWMRTQNVDTKLRRRLDRYDISVEYFKELFAKQEGRCAICSYEFESLYDRQVQTDHDHVTGLIRGLLCSDCNTSLGKFGDNIEGVKKVLNYLEKVNETIS